MDKSKRWAQNEKAYYAKLRLFSLLIIIVPIFPLSFFGSSASYDAMGTIVSLLSLGWVILGAIVGPVYFNRGMQVYDRFLKEPRHAYVSLTQAGVSEVSFNLTNASYYDAFSKANPGLNVKKSERIPWAVKFPSSLIYIALGFLVVVFLGLGIEFTISIAIRWIIAVVISLLPSFIFAKPDEFSPGGSDEEAPATDVENTADTYETEAETITERIEESEEPDEEEGLDWL
ncbi:MAG: hypothetical protein EAX95_07000 [Candidatus Thorarchaeota archaeon]|nr:hypothetical protein [Candidatus Thorarchaeota archaeon]